ncbi:hypothetical protein, partial [Salmonella enterica]|uniref:hypothetical protein n=1 Tax=Salmonella enterica TaxID=28901 RepID=UPI0035CAA949
MDSYPGLFPVLQGGDGSGATRGADCARLSAMPQGSETYQFKNQKLLLSIRQIALRPHY